MGYAELQEAPSIGRPFVIGASIAPITHCSVRYVVIEDLVLHGRDAVAGILPASKEQGRTEVVVPSLSGE